ncbi:hypothetical protein PAU_01725 [Photorhabdus asymbiotica]|uniref:Uncharacterized protein n=1 Tax=Photorhabdus asymbiotica subsp. asymbiotica (strain ATCC 43949 / 3105-77) TaxID=553480 RepID=C7BTG2_PHOAA|nr:hypothetical protein PAU_01725 [Photorhabdus asymbiotica]
MAVCAQLSINISNDEFKRKLGVICFPILNLELGIYPIDFELQRGGK